MLGYLSKVIDYGGQYIQSSNNYRSTEGYINHSRTEYKCASSSQGRIRIFFISQEALP